MKVALVSPYSWTYPGGVTRHIEALALELLAAGHDVRVVAPYDHRVRVVGDGGVVTLDECWHNQSPVYLETFKTFGANPLPLSRWSGESQEVRSRRVSAKGSWSAIQPAGPPIALTMSRPRPGLSSLAAARIDPPAKISRRNVVRVTALTASQPLKRRRPR